MVAQKTSQPHPKEKEGGERKEEGAEPHLPAPSQPVLSVYRKDINYGGPNPNSKVPKDQHFFLGDTNP